MSLMFLQAHILIASANMIGVLCSSASDYLVRLTTAISTTLGGFSTYRKSFLLPIVQWTYLSWNMNYWTNCYQQLSTFLGLNWDAALNRAVTQNGKTNGSLSCSRWELEKGTERRQIKGNNEQKDNENGKIAIWTSGCRHNFIPKFHEPFCPDQIRKSRTWKRNLLRVILRTGKGVQEIDKNISNEMRNWDWRRWASFWQNRDHLMTGFSVCTACIPGTYFISTGTTWPGGHDTVMTVMYRCVLKYCGMGIARNGTRRESQNKEAVFPRIFSFCHWNVNRQI